MDFRDLKVGDVVVCVNDKGWEDFDGKKHIKKGERYKVERVGENSVTINGIDVISDFETDFAFDDDLIVVSESDVRALMTFQEGTDLYENARDRLRQRLKR